MKKIALLVVTTIIVFACVRKQTLVEPEGTLAEYANHCYNGVLDGDEISIDCGGECGPCNFATPSCSPGTDILQIDASNYVLTGNSCGTPSNDFEMVGQYSNGNVTIVINGPAPDMTATYTAINSSILGTNQVSVRCTTSGLGTLWLSTGTVYFSQVGGKYLVTICGGSAYSFNTASNHTVSGSFSCP